MVTSTDALRRALERLQAEKQYRFKHGMRVPKHVNDEIRRIEAQLTPVGKTEHRAKAWRTINWYLVGGAAFLAGAAILYFFF
ncbi:hypothetical protein ZHS_99 [Edwardsiella phage vB_EpM_ZHS]|jgi:hypothetical protein|nr:hypothetical protein ZHS_99 [Edwardsiella phage vB_EpM_ZHS]